MTTTSHSTACLYHYALARLGLTDAPDLRTIFWDSHEALKWDDLTDAFIPVVTINDPCEFCNGQTSIEAQGKFS
jgi:hypothetical protein